MNASVIIIGGGDGTELARKENIIGHSQKHEIGYIDINPNLAYDNYTIEGYRTHFGPSSSYTIAIFEFQIFEYIPLY